LARLADALRLPLRPSATTLCLVRNDANLRELNQTYKDLARECELDHLILTENRDLIVRRKLWGVTCRKNFGLVVKPDQGDPGVAAHPIPIAADHIEIAKPPNRKSDTYKFVSQLCHAPG
jgi:hypothetical protein